MRKRAKRVGWCSKHIRPPVALYIKRNGRTYRRDDNDYASMVRMFYWKYSPLCSKCLQEKEEARAKKRAMLCLTQDRLERDEQLLINYLREQG